MFLCVSEREGRGCVQLARACAAPALARVCVGLLGGRLWVWLVFLCMLEWLLELVVSLLCHVRRGGHLLQVREGQRVVELVTQVRELLRVGGTARSAELSRGLRAHHHLVVRHSARLRTQTRMMMVR